MALGIATTIPVPMLARSPGSRRAASAAWRSYPASCSWARAGAWACGESRWKRTLKRDGARSAHTVEPRRDTRRARHGATTPSGAVLTLEVPRHVVQRRQHAAALERHEQVDCLEPVAELASMRALSAGFPPPSQPDHECARMTQLEHPALVIVEQVRPCSAPAAGGWRRHRSRRATSSTAASIASRSSSGADASTTCRIRSAFTVSSSVALKPRPAGEEASG